MKRQKMKIMLLGLSCCLFTAGIAYGQQVQLQGALIPKFVEPLPVAGDITVVDATQTVFGAPGPGYTPSTASPFQITAAEFQAQILPSAVNWPGAPTSCGGTTESWTWGYITPLDTQPSIRPSYLGPVVVAEKGVPFYPQYLNNLPVFGNVQKNLAIDMTLDWANPDGTDCLPDPTTHNYQNNVCGMLPAYLGPIPIATHLHGGEVAPAFDGGPDAWFTPDLVDNATSNPPADGIPDSSGPGWPGYVYEYPNEQQESTIWFHDHALGITRLNVYAGLAGAYPIIDPDPANAYKTAMPAFPAYDIPLIIQDRTFDTNCELYYNLASNPQPNPTVHPFWIPEFIGDTIVVNGKTWPYLEVEPRQYRFRFINGSNARFYDLSLGGGVKFFVIATDDGYLPQAVQTGNLIIGPGERYEVIVDFKTVKGQKNKPFKTVIMTNIANTPFPGGAPPVPGQTDMVMEFRVKLPFNEAVADTNIEKNTPIRATPIVPIVNAHVPATGSITRQLTLNEVIGPGGPLELVVNNSKFNAKNILPGCSTPLCRETEIPAVGDTEIWEIINITADAHPMHTHLTSFQILDRTPFRAAPWINQYDSLLLANGVPDGGGPPNQYNVKNADGAIGGNPAIGSYLDLRNRRPPLPYEMGWKDTVITYPGEVTRIVVRWDTTDTPVAADPAAAVGSSNYPFDPAILTGGVGYVWHCHIIDHEDNEMMRNYVVGTARQAVQ